MIPVADSVRTRGLPWVNLCFIVASIVVFLYELTLGPQLDALVMRWGATPVLVLRALGGDPRVPYAVFWTLVTSQFIHAGWGHLLGNLLFLWVFGRAVEDRLGHLGYMVLYLVWGVGAAMAQILLTGPSREPLVGASGAISGVLGAYLVLYPGAWVTLLVPIFFLFWTVDVPALLVLGYWFLTQFLNGAAAITRASHATAGIAFWAHVGGFVLGAASLVLLPTRRPSPTPTAALPVRRQKTSGVLWTVARVVSVAADIVAVLVAARVLLLLVARPGTVGPLASLVRLLYEVTLPLVEPFVGVLPALRIDGQLLELYSVAAAISYWGAGALLAWALATSSNRR